MYDVQFLPGKTSTDPHLLLLELVRNSYQGVQLQGRRQPTPLQRNQTQLFSAPTSTKI